MAADLVRTKPGVNILKKVKVGGVWKLCPAILDASGKLKDKVRVGGSVEPHSEGTYYIEWRENGRRRREAVPSATMCASGRAAK